jgi:hypothetical protein
MMPKLATEDGSSPASLLHLFFEKKLTKIGGEKKTRQLGTQAPVSLFLKKKKSLVCTWRYILSVTRKKTGLRIQGIEGLWSGGKKK